MHEELPRSAREHTKYTLKFGKLAAKVICAECYYEGAIALERKQRLAHACISSAVGWRKSKTVYEAGRWDGWEYVHIFSETSQRKIEESNLDLSGRLFKDEGFLDMPGCRNWQTIGA